MQDVIESFWVVDKASVYILSPNCAANPQFHWAENID
jgi:hypothetical protein